MIRILDPVVPFHPYPIAAGACFGFRCFDGEKWRDCDETGKPIIRKEVKDGD